MYFPTISASDTVFFREIKSSFSRFVKRKLTQKKGSNVHSFQRKSDFEIISTLPKTGQGVVDLMNGVAAAENAGAQVTDDSHGFTEFHHHHLLRDSLSVNTRFKMMISTVDSGFDSGSSPELHMSSLEDPPMSRTHQYRKVNIDNT